MGAHYFLGNQLLGISPRLPMWSDSQVEPTNQRLFCPNCGTIWGSVYISDKVLCSPVIRRCSQHGDGSFIAPWRQAFEELPPEVLRYELLLRLDKEP